MELLILLVKSCSVSVLEISMVRVIEPSMTWLKFLVVERFPAD